ncbi:helix-turn-helix transcriptional regulator [Microbacterium trichothecenolyticum]|uniref:TetR/AcrR family transcriptional regulator n=1 Tax=Microbacterium trichothecenolyticum TaxID=69370 RepID=UPI001C6EFE7E|nr:TetR family transcriptional regulator [Microbacterium trichothecenolyticum]MBW9121110.1 helix-turn-helix transcriptional regulator [Microbacterium trichothecenolyticum]
MSPQRADAARSRARILAVARECDPADLRLNHVARLAGVGVGTVYRHFPTAHALVEAVVASDLERYRGLAQRAAAERDPAAALDLLVREGLALQLADGGLQTVLLAPRDTSDDVAMLKRELEDVAESVVSAAREAGVVRTDLTTVRLQRLVCGIEHAVRIGGGADADFFVDAMLDGLRPAMLDGLRPEPPERPAP